MDTSGCLYKADLVSLLENLTIAPEVTPAPSPAVPLPAASGEEGVQHEERAHQSGSAGSSRSGAGIEARRQKTLNYMCQACHKYSEGIELLKCPKCKAVRYCNKECQLAAWKEHRPVCKKTQEDKKLASEMFGTEAALAFDAWVKRIKPYLLMAATSALWPSATDIPVLVLGFVQDPQQGSQVPTFSILPDYEIMTIEEGHEVLADMGGLFMGGPPPLATPGIMLFVVLESDFRVRVIPTSLTPDFQADIQSGKVPYPVSSYIQLINSGTL